MSEIILKTESIIKALHGAFCRDASRQELLQLAARRIRQVGSPFSAVYVYVAEKGLLHLEAFEGPPTRVTELSVEAHVEADLVAWIRRHDDVLGLIRVESDRPDRLGSSEADAVREVADALAALL